MKNRISGQFATIVLVAVVVAFANSLSPVAAASVSAFGGPQSVGLPVNSGDNESAAFLAPSGLSLYFSSTRAGGMGSIDIWLSQRATLSSAWGTPQNVTAVNSANNENLPVLSPDGRALFFSCSCPDAIGGTDIYMATRVNSNDDLGWTAPVNLGAVVNSSNNELGAGYFEDPATGAAVLYFTSDRSGLGGEDIFQSTRNANGTFNAPTNVATLNSDGNERGVSVSRNGLELFFGSDRDGGTGGRDTWVSTRASVTAQWNQPINVAAVNSPANDQMPALSHDGSTLYFSSSRDGSPDIYTARRVSVNRTPVADFDGDGRTDISVFRPTDGTWHVLKSSTNTHSVEQFGANGDKPTPGDFDGDSRTDLAVYRPSTGVWWIQPSSNKEMFTTILWGIATDRPVPADYDGDGRTDIAVYRNGTWYIVQSSTGTSRYEQFGLSTDIPFAGVSGP